MLLLVSGATATVQRTRDHHVGRMYSPAAGNVLRWDRPWCGDNDCFSGFSPTGYEKFLYSVRGIPNCRFINAPDVVGDSDGTIRLWWEWYERLLACGQPRGFVLQDGQEDRQIPYSEAYFIGGSTDWKLSECAADCVEEAKRRMSWVHMGRVNTLRRLQQAYDLGCDSIDGTGMSRFPDTIIPRMCRWISRIEMQGKLL